MMNHRSVWMIFYWFFIMGKWSKGEILYYKQKYINRHFFKEVKAGARISAKTVMVWLNNLLFEKKLLK